jgi:hypothetical protein
VQDDGDVLVMMMMHLETSLRCQLSWRNADSALSGKIDALVHVAARTRRRSPSGRSLPIEKGLKWERMVLPLPRHGTACKPWTLTGSIRRRRRLMLMSSRTVMAGNDCRRRLQIR